MQANAPHDEAQLLDLERRFMALIRAKDANGLRPLLAEGFVYRTPQGEDVGVQAFLDGITTLPVEILSLGGEHVKALVLGDTAVLTGVQVAVTRRDHADAPERSRGAFTDVFVRRAGAWRLLLAYSVDLPTDSSQPM